MKILKCHIENFGKLNDITIDFTENLNILNEKNAWGKSTLASFIKVMFFGFANESKRSMVENERKRYKPWQGGIYGGQLTFEVGEKRYEIIRTFGLKEKDDTFSLYDGETNLESTEYSSNIGEELFKIDRDSFGRSIYIAQKDCATYSTDGIHAKIGNLAENTDDMNNYEIVQKRLADCLNKMSPTRKTGSIKKLGQEIADLKVNLSKGSSLDTSITRLQQKIRDENDCRNKLKESQSQIQEEIKRMSAYEGMQAKQENYHSICVQYEESKKKAEDERKYFPLQIPGEEELQQNSRKAAEMAEYGTTMRQFALTKEEQDSWSSLEVVFQNQSLENERETIEDCKEKLEMLGKIKLQISKESLTKEEQHNLQNLKTKFDKGVPSDSQVEEQIADWKQRTQKKNALETKEASLATLENLYRLSGAQPTKPEKGNEKNNARAFIITGILIAVIGMIAFFFHRSVAITGFIIGSVLIIAAFARSRKKKADNAPTEDKKANMEEECRALQEEIKEDWALIQKIENKIQAFFSQYKIKYEEDSVLEKLYQMRSQMEDFRHLIQKQEEYKKKNREGTCMQLEETISSFLMKYYSAEQIAEKSYQSILQDLEKQMQEYQLLDLQKQRYQIARDNYHSLQLEITRFIKELGCKVKEDLALQLQEIRDHLITYKRTKDDVQKAKQEKVNFESKNSVEKLAGISVTGEEQSLEVLHERLTNLLEKLDESAENISNYQKQMDDLQEQRDEISDDEELYKKRKEEKEVLEHRFKILNLTKDFLGKAKESLTARYMAPIMNGFTKYYKILASQDLASYKIDANINITAREQGEQRDINLLSIGYQDLIGICMRMALVDAMYQEEKPFILFDDPFVNLDDDKVEGGLKFLEDISREYQVIYFTCHESRGAEQIKGVV